MYVDEFLAHKNPSRHRIFAVMRDESDRLEVVTTLGTQDLHLTDKLTDALNDFLNDRDNHTIGRHEKDTVGVQVRTTLSTVMERLPEAVQVGIQSFLDGLPLAELGDLSPWTGRIRVLSTSYFTSDSYELEIYLEGAYTMGLGVRAWNEIDKGQETGWAVELRTAPGFAEADQEPRSWVLPPTAPLKHTWSTCTAPTKGNPTQAALEVAKKASTEGRQVRMHIVEHD